MTDFANVRDALVQARAALNTALGDTHDDLGRPSRRRVLRRRIETCTAAIQELDAAAEPETPAMMPKVTLKAPPGVGGQIHASQSGKNYDITADGTVTVDSADVRDLLGAGFQALPHDGGPDSETAAPITSPSPTADVVGSTALRPEDREADRREVPPDTGQHNEDFGKAVPPHGIPQDLGTDPAKRAARQADADAAAETAARSGAPQSAASAQPNTGSQTQPAGNEAQQDAAAQRVEKGEPSPSSDRAPIGREPEAVEHPREPASAA